MPLLAPVKKAPPVEATLKKRKRKSLWFAVVGLSLLMTGVIIWFVWPSLALRQAAANIRSDRLAQRPIGFEVMTQLPFDKNIFKVSPHGQVVGSDFELQTELDLRNFDIPASLPLQIRRVEDETYLKLDTPDQLVATLSKEAAAPASVAALSQLTAELKQKWIQLSTNDLKGLPLLRKCSLQLDQLGKLDYGWQGFGRNNRQLQHVYTATLDTNHQAQLFGADCADAALLTVGLRVNLINRSLQQISFVATAAGKAESRLLVHLSYPKSAAKPSKPKQVVSLLQLRQQLESILGRPVEDLL